MIRLYDPEVTSKDISIVLKTLEKKWLSGNTPIIKEFEEKLANFLGVKYVSSCSSGTSALHLALLSLGLSPGDEVIMPSLSYIATANAVSYVGGKSVFVDVNANTWQVDVKQIENSITKKTKAIIPVHLYGGVPDLKSISSIAKKYNLKIVHDSAEALGSKFQKKFSTNFRDVSILSFFPNKVITTGEGGAVCTNNRSIYEKIEKLKSQGLKGKVEYLHSDIGYNYRMSSMSAALGVSQVDRITKYIKMKEKLFKNYQKELTPFGFRFQQFNLNTTPSYWLIACIVPEGKSRNALKSYLYEKNIETRNIFIPLHLQPPYKKSFNKNTFRNSTYISKNGICLPSSPNLSDKEFKKIIKSIKNYLYN